MNEIFFTSSGKKIRFLTLTIAYYIAVIYYVQCFLN